jgi:hypothetical protein
MINHENKENNSDRRNEERIACLWQCLTGDLRQRHKTEGCGHWNTSNKREVKGQTWCEKCRRRTRINHGRVNIYPTITEAKREAEMRNREMV